MKHPLQASFLAFLAALCISATSRASEPVRFLVLGDCRNYPGFTTLLKSAKALPDGPGTFVITPGDIDPPDLVRTEIAKTIGKNIPWFPVVGNHDANKTSMTYLRNYLAKELPALFPPHISAFTPGPPGAAESTYSFDAGPVHIAVINEYWDGTKTRDADFKSREDVVPALNQWLDADLKKSTQPWKIVVGHEPAFPQADQDWSRLEPKVNSERHAESSLNAKVEHRDAFVKTLADNHVTAYFCGHTHRYSRFQMPNTSIWQIDSAQARGETKSWKYDAFLIVAASDTEFKVSVYRNLKTRGTFELTDHLDLPTPAATPAATQAATQLQPTPPPAKPPANNTSPETNAPIPQAGRV